MIGQIALEEIKADISFRDRLINAAKESDPRYRMKIQNEETRDHDTNSDRFNHSSFDPRSEYSEKVSAGHDYTGTIKH